MSLPTVIPELAAEWESIAAEAAALPPPHAAGRCFTADGSAFRAQHWENQQLMAQLLAAHEKTAAWTLRQGTEAEMEWVNWGLICAGAELPRNCELMPKTIELVRAVAARYKVHKAGVSMIAAGATLPPHDDAGSMPSDAALTYHLGLATPTRAALRLLDSNGDAIAELRERPGREIVFDARNTHTAYVAGAAPTKQIEMTMKTARQILYLEIELPTEMQTTIATIEAMEAANISGEVVKVIGPMFSGKTNDAMYHCMRSLAIKRKVAYITHATDTRFGEDGGESRAHNGFGLRRTQSADADTPRAGTLRTDDPNLIMLRVDRLADATLQMADAKFVIVDEGQFFPDLLPTVTAWAAAGRSVRVYGLDFTAELEPFGDMLALPSDVIEHRYALCTCGRHAMFTRRLLPREGGAVDVGGDEKYAATCRKHHPLLMDQKV